MRVCENERVELQINNHHQLGRVKEVRDNDVVVYFDNDHVGVFGINNFHVMRGDRWVLVERNEEITNGQFHVGDEIWTPIDPYSYKEKDVRRAVVIRAYRRLNTMFGDYPELYDLRFEDGMVRHGHFPTGLTKTKEEWSRWWNSQSSKSKN